ncbi:MAG: AsmA family protein [Proteobacteria bacterium]|nr:AsmA family protein [Pseudomonadota bacterium]
MNKMLKYTGFVLAGVIGLLLVAVVILKLIPDDQYKSWLTSAVESSTGRGFAIESLQLDFGTSLRIGADTIQLANADWAEKPDMLSVNRLEAELRLLPLLSGKAEIITRLDTADLISQSNEDGVSNWDLSAGLPPEEASEEAMQADADEQQGSGLPLRPILRELRIDNLTFSLIDKTDDRYKTAVLKHLLIETPELQTLLSLEADANGIPISLSGNLGNIDSALDQISTPLTINGQFDDNELSISGEWGPVLPATNLNLLLDIKVPSTSSLAAIAGYDIEDIGEIALSARARANDGVFSIEDIITKLDGELTTSSIDGGIENLMLLDGVDMGVTLYTETLERLVETFNVELPVPLPPEVQLSAQVQGSKNGLAINDINIIAHDEGVEFALTGAVNNILSSRQIDGEFNATVDSLSRLSKYANMELPALGAISLSGNLQSAGKALSLRALDLGLTADNLKLKVAGGVEDLLTVDGINAQVDADISSLTEQNISELTTLLKSFGVELPVEMLPQSLNLSTGVQGNLEQLALTEINAGVLDKGIKISLLGAVENVLAPAGITANVRLNSDSVTAFSKYAGTKLPDLGPLEATANLESSGESYRLKSLQANLASDVLQADVSASIADLLAVSGISAEVTANTPTLASLSALAQTELPDTDPVKVHAMLNGESMEQAKLVVNAQSAGAQVTVNSLISQLTAADQIQLDVSLMADKLSDFDKFAQMELPDQGPLDLSASINIEPGTYTLSALKLQLNDQSATGDLRLHLPETDDEQGITLLHGQLDIAYLDLSPFLPGAEQEDELTDTEVTPETPVEPVEETTEAVEAAEAPKEDITTPLAESDRLLSSEPILFEVLHDYDIDLSVNGEKLKLDHSDLLDVQLKVLLKDGLLSVKPVKAIGSTGGTVDGTIIVDGRSTLPVLDADIVLDSIPSPNLGGTSDFHLGIDGQGESIAALMASLNGEMVFAIRDGVIPKSFVSRFGSGLMSSSGSKETTNLECLILRVDVVDGVADFKNKLAAQLTEVTWRGGGTIDFNTERLSADIAPTPRKGIPVSIGGGLAGLVKLGGTLKAPKILPDYSDAAFKYGKYSAYVATGGLSLLAEIIANKISANKDVCEQILDGSVFAAADKVKRKNLPK